MTEIERDSLVDALRAQLCWCGLVEEWAESVPRALGWLRARWGEGEDHLPLNLVHDLGHVLLRGRAIRAASGRDLGRWPPHERALRLAYEDRFVSRWLLDSSVHEAHVTLAGLPGEVRDRAIAHAIGLAFAGLSADGLPRGNAAHLRARADEVGAGEEAEPSASAEWRAAAAAWTEALLAGIPDGRLFDEADLWELAHFAELPSDSARLALRALHEVQSDAGRVTPSVAAHAKRRAQEVPVDLEAADTFPAGGFDAIATRGRFENLVRSEVVYVGVGEEVGVDLFDVRYVQGELLYYTRDESPLLDAHRVFAVVVDAPAELRRKDSELPTQDLVLAQGLGLALRADLADVFGPHALTLHWRWRLREVEDLDVAAEEEGLVALALGAEIAHRRVTLDTLEDLEELERLPGVVFSPRVAPAVGRRRHVWVQVGGPAWCVSRGDTSTTHDLRDADGSRALLDAILESLVSAAPAVR